MRLYILIPIFIILFTFNMNAQSEPVFQIDSCTKVFLNHDKTAFQVQFDNGDLQLKSDWKNDNYISSFYEIYNQVLPIHFFFMEGYLISSLFHNNYIKVQDPIKYNSSKYFEEYFTIELHHNKLFIQNSNLKTKNLHIINLKTGEKREFLNVLKTGKNGPFIYTCKYSKGYPINEQGFIYIYNSKVDTAKWISDNSIINSIPYAKLPSFEESFCKQFKLPFTKESNAIQPEINTPNFVSSFKRYNSDDNYRASLIKSGVELYRSPHSIVIFVDNSVLIVDDEKKEIFQLTRDNHYYSSYTTIRIKDDILRLTEFADEKLKTRKYPSIQFYSLKNNTCLLRSLPSMNVSEIYKKAFNTLNNSEILYFDILNDQVVYSNNSYHLINHQGKPTELTTKTTKNLIKKTYRTDSIWQYCPEGSQDKLNELKNLNFIPNAVSKTSGFYKVLNKEGDFLVNHNSYYFDRSFKIGPNVIDIIPIGDNLMMKINKNKTFSIIAKSYHYNKNRYPELNYVEIKLPKSIIGINSKLNHNREIDEFNLVSNLNYDETSRESFNNCIQNLKAGVIPISKNVAIIKAWEDNYVAIHDKLDNEGEPLYDAEGFPLTEERIQIGAFNSGVYNFEKNKWVIPPSAEGINITDNGFITTTPLYEDNLWSKKFKAYDLEGNELWEQEIRSDKDRKKIVKLICKENNQEIFQEVGKHFLVKDKKGKQSLIYQGAWNGIYNYDVSNVDVILSVDPLLYQKKDSIFIESYELINGRITNKKVTSFLTTNPSEVIHLYMHKNTRTYVIYNKSTGKKQEIQLGFRYTYPNGVLIKRNNKLAFIKSRYSEDALDEEGEPKYDKEGFPLTIEVQPNSFVFQKNENQYQLLFNEMLPVIGNQFYGYLVKDSIDGRLVSKYEFYNQKGEPHTKLNAELIQNAYQEEMSDYIIGYISSNKDNKAILIDPYGDILARNYYRFSRNNNNELVGTKLIDGNYVDVVLELK